MEHLRKYGVLYLIIIAVIVGGIYYIVTNDLFSKWFPKRAGDGREPTDDDMYCNGGTRGTEEACTKPLYEKKEGMKERVFLMETDDYPYNKCIPMVKDKNGKEWFFSYKNNKRCVFIDNKSYPTVAPLTEEEKKLWEDAKKMIIEKTHRSNCLHGCPCHNNPEENRDYNRRFRPKIIKAIDNKENSLTAIFWKRELIDYVKEKRPNDPKSARQLLQSEIEKYVCKNM